MNAIFSFGEASNSVSQGSVIRPLLFLLYMNYIDDLPADNDLIFTDDVELIYPRLDMKLLKHSFSIFSSALLG